MSEAKHTVYKMQRLKKLLRKTLHLSDDQLSQWLLMNRLSNDRNGCLNAIKIRFPWMLGKIIK